MSPGITVPVATGISFPRVSGDEPTGTQARSAAASFSPRERG